MTEKIKLNKMQPIIELQNVSKTYPQQKEITEIALKDFSLSVIKGEFVCLIGPSGCGKSTVLKIIAGLETATSGVVKKPDNISMVFQSGALLPWLTVSENAAFGLHATGMSENEAVKKSREYLDILGLIPYADKYPRDLSGGQRQRVGIARALAVKPEVLLMDEPFSALDPKTTHELHLDLLKIWLDTKITIIMVSHLIEEAVTLAQHVILMKEGMLKEVERIRRVFFA
jgi:NitT/TauT family transport system ATP-binding protein